MIFHLNTKVTLNVLCRQQEKTFCIKIVGYYIMSSLNNKKFMNQIGVYLNGI